MRRRVAILERLRSPARIAPAAWTVALAILLQTALGGPLAVRMALAAEAPNGATLCLEHRHHDEGAAAEENPAPAPASVHHHETCLLCHGALAPLLLTAVAPPAVPAGFDAAPPAIVAAATKPDHSAHAYLSRGPPAA